MATRSPRSPRRRASEKAKTAAAATTRPGPSTAKRSRRKATAKTKAGTPASKSLAPRTTRSVETKFAGALVTTAPSRDDPRWSATLKDGTRVLIRPIHKEDAAIERAFLKRLSPESRRLRFLGQMSEPSEGLIRNLTEIDYRRDMAFVALVHRDGEKREIGVARYSTSADGKNCECAVTVGDEWRNRGLGTLLMQHLIDVARSRGVQSMMSIDEADNTGMRDLAKFLGFRRKRDPDDPTLVIHTLTL
jgi:GNAT superfamily N-acetyltransferase